MKKRCNCLISIKRWSICAGVLLMGLQATAQQHSIPKPEVARYSRMAPGLAQALRKAGAGSVRVEVRNKSRFLSWMTENGYKGNLAPTTSASHVLILTNVSEQELKLLSNCPEVAYIDKPNRKAKEEIELRDADFAVNNIYSIRSLYPLLNGNTMAASVKEGAFNPYDLDLQGRAIAPESFGNEYTSHATTMATIIAGAGNTGPKGRGIADKATLAYSSFAELLPDQSQPLLDKGISLQNHSYGVGVENYYGLESAAYDRETYQHPTLLHVFSSGNSGDKADEVGTYAGITGFANLTGQFKTSKNTLSAGALEPTGNVGILSSKGPAYDGRVKPELVAYGKGGTSEAAAVVSGVALLVQQAYKEQYNSLPPATLVKAALINSADDAGRPEVDFEAGFGNTDALGAIRSIRDNRFILATVANGAAQQHTITVPNGARKLKVTLVWHDVEATPEANHAIVNDLDLVVTNSSTAASWKPWVLSSYPHPDSLKLPAKRRADHLNNVEQVTLAAPVSGTYQLQVIGYSVPQGPQAYSIVYEFDTGPEWVYPAQNLSMQAGSINRVRWQGALPGEKGRLEYKLSGSDTWQLIADNLDLNNSYFDWQAPDAVAKAQLRLTTPAATITSGEFILTRQLKLKVGYNCDDNTMVHWSALPNVVQYQLYQIGATHLEPLLTTTDTLALLQQQQLQRLPEFVNVAPIIGGTPADVSEAVNFSQSGAGCYIRNFLPEQYVTSHVNLKLELSTLYQVASVTLERFVNGQSTEVQTVSPVSQLSFMLHDAAPALGKNLYLVKVTTTDGRTFYSNKEEVLYADEKYVQAYPNPVTAGETLSIVVASDVSVIQLYDQMGKLVFESEEYGMIKQIATAGFKSGLYILRLKSETGNYVVGKVLVL